MTMMMTDSGEAVFINIAGKINPETLGQVANTMGFGGILESFGGGALNNLQGLQDVPGITENDSGDVSEE